MLHPLSTNRSGWRAVLASCRFWLALTALAVAVLYLSTVQLQVNGSGSPYTNDVGEIQNALPRWGTLHMPGYPLYSLLGSSFVTLLRWTGVAPAAGTSLFSLLWGIATAVLVCALAMELGAAPALAALGAIAASLATSLWADSSLAEVYTMTMAFFVGTLYFAVRFGERGERRDLLWLALAFSMGLAHHRTLALLLPAIGLLIWPRRQELRPSLWPVLGFAALGPLTYLYLPIRAWQGANWTFGAVGTWRGFLQIALWTNERVAMIPQGLSGWLARAKIVAQLLNDDLWLPMLGLGLAGLCALLWRRGAWRKPVALTLAWLPTLPLSLVVWEGRVTDALLATKLPLLVMAGIGLALAADAVRRLDRRAGWLAAALLAAAIGSEVWVHRPPIVAITRDQSAERTIALAEQVAHPDGDRPVTLMTLWSHTYWALAYAQAYRGQLAGLTLVDHNADFAAIARRGDRLLTFADTFYIYPIGWWDGKLGRAYLSSPLPGIVELSLAPADAATAPGGRGLDLGNGVRILSASLSPERPDGRVLTVYWEACGPIDGDYSVAVHLLAQDPPQGPADILAQADRSNPVEGWYPTSRWTPGEVVRDAYLIATPPGSRPCAVRVGMYRAQSDGTFANSPWLTIPLPAGETRGS